MPRGITWNRELTEVLNEDVSGAGRMTGAASGAEVSLQIDESLFRKSENGGGLLGDQIFRSADLSAMDSLDFGDEKQISELDGAAARKGAPTAATTTTNTTTAATISSTDAVTKMKGKPTTMGATRTLPHHTGKESTKATVNV